MIETESKNWTRFTKEKLYQLRNFCFETDKNEIRVLHGRRYYIEEADTSNIFNVSVTQREILFHVFEIWWQLGLIYLSNKLLY